MGSIQNTNIEGLVGCKMITWEDSVLYIMLFKTIAFCVNIMMAIVLVAFDVVCVFLK